MKCRRKSSHIRRRVGCDDWKAGRGKRGKGPVAAISGAGAIGGHDSEMVPGAGSQATDVRTNTLGHVPGLTMGGSRESVADRCPILKIYAGGQSVGVNRAVKYG